MKIIFYFLHKTISFLEGEIILRSKNKKRLA